jgi:hypothetical protein
MYKYECSFSQVVFGKAGVDEKMDVEDSRHLDGNNGTGAP